jgi:hypothetical protein
MALVICVTEIPTYLNNETCIIIILLKDIIVLLFTPDGLNSRLSFRSHRDYDAADIT